MCKLQGKNAEPFSASINLSLAYKTKAYLRYLLYEQQCCLVLINQATFLAIKGSGFVYWIRH